MDVSNTLTFILFPNMIGHGLDVVLEHVHISENSVIDALQDVFRFGLAFDHNLIGVVDDAVAQRHNVFDGVRIDEMTRYGKKFVHGWNFLAKIGVFTDKFIFLPTKSIHIV